MKTILHSDLNNFYASVECVYDPSLRSRPIAVCGDPNERHGIVLAKNMLAKRMGVTTGEAIWQARMKCPNLHIVPPDFSKYVRFSRMMRAIYAEYTNLIEPFGIDEAWLDVTDHALGGEQIADELRARAKAELGLTLSVGVSYNKIFAKLGSDLKKPDATTVISPENFREKIWPLPVREILYAGPATCRKLYSRNLRTIGDVARCSPEVLGAMLGKHGAMLWTFANGLDRSPVRSIDDVDTVKSVGNSTTTPRDLVCEQEVRTVVTTLAESVAERLHRQGLRGKVVELSIRDCELRCLTRQHKVARPTALSGEIIACAMALFREHYHWEHPIRSLGVSVSSLESENSDEQLTMFPNPGGERMRALEGTVEGIRRQFGHFSILRASLLANPEIGGLHSGEGHRLFTQRDGRE